MTFLSLTSQCFSRPRPVSLRARLPSCFAHRGRVQAPVTRRSRALHSPAAGGGNVALRACCSRPPCSRRRTRRSVFVCAPICVAARPGRGRGPLAGLVWSRPACRHALVSLVSAAPARPRQSAAGMSSGPRPVSSPRGYREGKPLFFSALRGLRGQPRDALPRIEAYRRRVLFFTRGLRPHSVRAHHSRGAS